MDSGIAPLFPETHWEGSQLNEHMAQLFWGPAVNWQVTPKVRMGVAAMW